MLLSRVADALYWISRYLERAEHTARLIDVRLDLDLDRSFTKQGWVFDRLFNALRIQKVPADIVTPSALVESLMFDPGNAHSVMACVTSARENARQVREEISSDMWEQINALFLSLKAAGDEENRSAQPHYVSRLVIDGVHLFKGVTDETMGHGEGWHHLQFGRYLERAGATAALVDLHFIHGAQLPAGHIEWVGLLRSCCALEAYCRCYTADLRPERIAEFLLLNPEFPRSVRFAGARIEGSLRAVAQLTGRAPGGRPDRLAGRLHATLGYGQVDEILDDDLHAYLQSVERHCGQIHAAAAQTYVRYPIETALPA